MEKNLKCWKVVDGFLGFLDEFFEEFESVRKIIEVMNVEVRIRGEYYICWDNVLFEGFKIVKRIRRLLENEMNVLISFFNFCFYVIIVSEFYNIQFVLMVSYFYEFGERRFLFVFDLSEIFKLIIVDRIVNRFVKQGIIKREYFRGELNGVLFIKEGMKVVLKVYNEELGRSVKYLGFKKNVIKQRFICFEVYKLIKYFVGVKDYELLVVWF